MAIDTLKASRVDPVLWLPAKEIESAALDQIRNIGSLPWAVHVAVMPDCHFGKGATVGSVIGLKGAVSPSAVGVDIGCGAMATKTNLLADHLPDSLRNLRNNIEKQVPVGFNYHDNNRKLPKSFECAYFNKMQKIMDDFYSLDSRVANLRNKAILQLGTLGGGNHFIELCLDEKQNVWIMLHSGSRYIGKTLADIHINTAKKLIHNQKLPDLDLAVFLSGTPEMEAYRRDLHWAQNYAALNRLYMLEIIKEVMQKNFPDIVFEQTIACHHNYVSEEKHFGEDLFVTRKGAISAKKGEMGIIPGSMGAKSFIVRGLGNPESMCSASHGAGRVMSRNKAKKQFTIKNLVDQTDGVECKKDLSVIDEIPAAYKDIEQVMNRQKDLVEIVATLKQIICIKG